MMIIQLSQLFSVYNCAWKPKKNRYLHIFLLIEQQNNNLKYYLKAIKAVNTHHNI